jgi:prepilin-type N-terminal cleavage/methylation domain-containing protein
MVPLIQFDFQRPDLSALRFALGADKRTLNVNKAGRDGFTLVELLVVIALLMVLAAIAVMFVPRIEEGQRAARGAALLQGWLNIAKQRALRDQQARGLRLYVSSNIVTDCQYLDLPDDFTGGTLTATAGSTTATISADLSGGFGTSSALWPVQPGDYLLILSSGLVHQITAVSPSTNTVTLASAIPFAVNATANYRILRSPRVSGEEKLSLPLNIGIRVDTNATYANAQYGNNLTANSDGNIDILFSPSGNVIGDQAGTDKVILWVCDTSLANTPWDGEPTLITVYTRSGLVAPVPVDPDGINYNGTTNKTSTPYSFTPNP